MAWGTAYKTKLKWIQTKQNQFVPCIFFAHKRENAKIYYALLEILKLDDMFKMKIALFAHKIQKDKKSIPAFFSLVLLHQHQNSVTITPGMHQVKTFIQ